MNERGITSFHESQEDYVERILMLGQGKEGVRSVDLARSFSYSKASVSVAVRKMEDKGLIRLDEHGLIYLTEQGMAIAGRVYERHQVLEKALLSLGVDEENARRDACLIEHDLSEESFQAIKAHMELFLDKR